MVPNNSIQPTPSARLMSSAMQFQTQVLNIFLVIGFMKTSFNFFVIFFL